MNLNFLTGKNIITAYELKNSYIKMKCPDYLKSEFPFSYIVGTITNAYYDKYTGDIAIAIKTNYMDITFTYTINIPQDKTILQYFKEQGIQIGEWQKFVWFNFFEPTDEFLEFCKSIGYENPLFNNYTDIGWDDRIIKYIEENADFVSSKFPDRKGLRGKPTYKYRIGFHGVATVLTADTSVPWCIKYDNVDNPIVVYPVINTDKHNFADITYIHKDEVNSIE